jgi:hypothetical protein
MNRSSQRKAARSFDEVELTTIREATPGDLARRAHHVASEAKPSVVDEEHAALRLQRPTHELPERVEEPTRNVRVPETKEADVELTRRLPLKHVGEDILGRSARPRAVQLEHLGNCVDGGHRIRKAKELLGPHPGPGGELEDVTPRSERFERSLKLPHVGEPPGSGLRV